VRYWKALPIKKRFVHRHAVRSDPTRTTSDGKTKFHIDDEDEKLSQMKTNGEDQGDDDDDEMEEEDQQEEDEENHPPPKKSSVSRV
jgi:hypothetical protein